MDSSIASRLKEERLRLGLSQTAFAVLAGATKSAQISWEKGASSPTAQAMEAFADAGADITYIIVGRRAEERRADAIMEVREHLASVRRNLIDPSSQRLDGETEQRAEARILATSRNTLKIMLSADTQLMDAGLREEAEGLLRMVDDPDELHRARSEAYGQIKASREQARRRLLDWLEVEDGQPSEMAIHVLTTIAAEYGVPVRMLADLVEELRS